MTDSNDRDPRRGARPDGRASGAGAKRGLASRPAEPAEPTEERIAKVIARAGIASRRDAEAMIADGRVTLDGVVLASPAVNVGPDARITVDDEPLPLRERTRLWLFHKPRGLVTTARDPEGRPTVFEALPDEMPRVVAVGRLDINTEGLLLLTNDGGLAKVIAHPETGWTRRYRVRARGEVTQADLDTLARGVTVDGMEYGPIDATLDRVQGENAWMTLALKEGKNREVKRVLENLGLQVNRLIRLSFGPFQLGELEPGLVEEVRTRVLKDQLGQTLAAEAGVDFASPVREPIAPFGSPKGEARAERPARTTPPRPRRAGDEPPFRARPTGYGRPERGRTFPDRGAGPDRGRAPERERDDRPVRPPREKRSTVWRGDEEAPRAARHHDRREDPRTERQSAERRRERVGAVSAGAGQRVLVERVKARPDRDERPRRERPRPTEGERADGGARVRTERPGGSFKKRASGGGDQRFGGRPNGSGDKPRASAPRPAGGGFKGGGFKGGTGKADSRPSGGRPGFGKPGGAGRPGGSRPGGSRPGGSRPGGSRPRGDAPRGRGPGR